MSKIAAIICGVLLSSTLAAQSTQAAQVRYQRKTSVYFEPQAVDGTQVGPEGTLLTRRKQVRFSNAIKLRSHFRD